MEKMDFPVQQKKVGLMGSSIKKRAGIFFFYDNDGIVDRYIDYYLKELKTVTDYLVVVVNGKITPEGRSKFTDLSDGFFVRENVGFDVWAYHDALDYIGWDDLAEYDELILANYTIFGPFYPLCCAFEKMEEVSCDWWGLHRRYEDRSTANYGGNELKYGYLPEVTLSNFWVIRSRLLHSYEFRRYWENIPPISSYLESCAYHEPTFTVTMTDAGFTFDTFDGESQRDWYRTPTVAGAYDQLVRLKLPFVRRKAFFDPNSSVFDYGPTVPAQILAYIQENTDYDVGLIWENLLRTVNQYDLKNWLHLNAILPVCGHAFPKAEVLRMAVVCYFAETDSGEYMFSYLKNFPEGTTVVCITDIEEKLLQLTQRAAQYKHLQIQFRLGDHRGRNVSALLVGARDLVLSGAYDLICVLHDMIDPRLKPQCVGQVFRNGCFDNVAKSRNYIENVRSLFAKEERLGIAVPPSPTHSTFYKEVGGEWGIRENLPHVRELLDSMGLNVPLRSDKPPVFPKGSVFWFRCNALRPLFEKEWRIEDFPDEPHEFDSGTIFEMVERAYPLVAQAMGYYPTVILTPEYASCELTHMTYETQQYFRLTAQLKPRSVRSSTSEIQRRRFLALVKSSDNGTSAESARGKWRETLKKLIRALLPIGLWNLLRKMKWGDRYVEDDQNSSTLKRVIKACCPRLIWDGLRWIKYGNYNQHS